MTKFCCSCEETKLITDFSFKKRYKDGINSVCKTCVILYERARRAKNVDKERENNRKAYWKNPEKAKHKSRFHRFKIKYWPSLTIKQCEIEWNKLFAAQNGLCSICKKQKPLEVEHCHKTGKVRSLAYNGRIMAV